MGASPLAEHIWLCSFNAYAGLVEDKLLQKYKGVPHWAKLEVDRMGKEGARKLLSDRYPVAKFNAARDQLDPKNILSNDMMDAVFPRGMSSV
jgi:L-galactono-1,4-lactone dehydrogenase